MSIKYFMLFILVITSCVNDTNSVDKNPVTSLTTKTGTTQDLNISIFIDLSDRIDTVKYPNQSMQYYKRDVAYIKQIADVFIDNLKRKKIIQMNDNIQVYFDPEPLNNTINDISEKLRFSINRSNASLELLDSVRHLYSTEIEEIYNLAINDKHYIGSDIWGFFKDKVSDCIINDKRNILVILTDGYIFHKNRKIEDNNLTSYLTPQDIKKFKLNDSKWEEKISQKKYGFIPANKNLNQLEVLVLGINPNPTNPYEGDVLNKYWSDWFDSMQIKRYSIKKTELPANMKKIIIDFISN